MRDFHIHYNLNIDGVDFDNAVIHLAPFSAKQWGIVQGRVDIFVSASESERTLQTTLFDYIITFCTV